MRWSLYLGAGLGWIYGGSQVTTNRPLALLYFCCGLLSWTFMEYAVHRWFLHRHNMIASGSDPLRCWHRAHHATPEAPHRLPLPLPFSLTGYAMCLIVAWSWSQTWPLAGLAATGWSLGYLAYEWLHRMYHLGTPQHRISRALRRHHLIHHYAEPERAFGITTPFWDLFFWTWPRHRAPLTLATEQKKWLRR